MHRKTVIVLLTADEVLVVRGNFTKVCAEYNLPYHYLKRRKFPIEYKGYIIHKVDFK